MQYVNHKTSVNIIIASILLALFADTKVINLIVVAAIPSMAGSFMSTMYAIAIIGLIFVGTIWQGQKGLSLSRSQLFICILCILWYLCTLIFVDTPSVSALFFFTFTIVPLLTPGIVKIDVRIFLLALMTLPFLGVFYIDRIFINEVKELGVVSMGACYAIIVPILANLIYLRFFYGYERKTVKILLLIFTLINLFYLIQISLFGSRGPVFCVLLLICCLLIIKEDANNRISIRKGRFLILSLSVVFVAMFFISTLQFISNFMNGYDISINVVDKFLRMNEINDISNGRNEIHDIAYSGILHSLFWGHGISQFENNTGIVYPHHSIIQFLYDGGIILTLCILIPICINLIKKLKRTHRDGIACLLFLFFASVPGSFFSGDVWLSPVLWMFFGFVLRKDSKTKFI